MGVQLFVLVSVLFVVFGGAGACIMYSSCAFCVRVCFFDYGTETQHCVFPCLCVSSAVALLRVCLTYLICAFTRSLCVCWVAS